MAGVITLLAILIASTLIVSGGHGAMRKPEQHPVKHSQQSSRPQTGPQQATTDERGSEKLPVVVKLLSSSKTEAETAQEAKRVQAQHNAEWWIGALTAALVGVGLLQLVAFISQAVRLKQTLDVVRDTAERQLRAYLGVTYWGLVSQDYTTQYRFELQCSLVNRGTTPAQDVSYRAQADVLPFPLPDGFAFPPPNLPATSAGTVWPQQQFILSASVSRMYSAEEIAEIKNGATMRLYIYGTVTYTDAFRKPRHSNFSQSIVWLRDGNTVGFNTRIHNDAS